MGGFSKPYSVYYALGGLSAVAVLVFVYRLYRQRNMMKDLVYSLVFFIYDALLLISPSLDRHTIRSLDIF
jgi:hypothetical protein